MKVCGLACAHPVFYDLPSALFYISKNTNLHKMVFVKNLNGPFELAISSVLFLKFTALQLL